MKKSIILIAFILLSTVVLHAQQEKLLYLYQTSVQFQEVDFRGFNQQLEDLNLLTLRNSAIEMGAGLTMIYRRSSSDFTITYGNQQSRTDDTSGPYSRFRYVGIRANQGFNILNPEGDWFFGPELTLSASFQQVAITGRNNSTNFIEAANYATFNFERIAFTSGLGVNFTDYNGLR